MKNLIFLLLVCSQLFAGIIIGPPPGGGSGSGTVTSVAMSVPSIMSVSGSPVTTTGTLAVTLQTEAANIIFAGPTTGSAATPTFRALVAADIPTISLTAGVSGILPVVNGGTGVTNAQTNISTTGTINNYAPATANIYFTNASQTIITGMVAPSQAAQYVICANGSDAVDLAYQNSGSSAANRFDLQNSQAFRIYLGHCAIAKYNTSTTRWNVISASPLNYIGGVGVSLTPNGLGTVSVGIGQDVGTTAVVAFSSITSNFNGFTFLNADAGTLEWNGDIIVDVGDGQLKWQGQTMFEWTEFGVPSFPNIFSAGLGFTPATLNNLPADVSSPDPAVWVKFKLNGSYYYMPAWGPVL